MPRGSATKRQAQRESSDRGSGAARHGTNNANAPIGMLQAHTRENYAVPFAQGTSGFVRRSTPERSGTSFERNGAKCTTPERAHLDFSRIGHPP